MSQPRIPWLSIVLLIGVILSVAGCAPAPTATPTAIRLATVVPTAGISVSTVHLPEDISVADTAAKRDAGAFILDVRTPEEWNEFHISGATLIPLDQLEMRLNEVPKDKEVVVVCRSGNRSKVGRDALKAAGYTQVTSMAGGLNAWKAAGLPTVAGP